MIYKINSQMIDKLVVYTKRSASYIYYHQIQHTLYINNLIK